MHPCWQIKQAVHIKGEYYIDQCNVIGSSASGAIFIAVNSLIAWIAKNKRGVRHLASYVDDSFGLAVRNDEEAYLPYGRSFPSPQARLLCLWDDLGVPHKERKQLSGSPLTIIGDTHELHLPSENAYLAHRHTLRLSLFTRARACAIALSLQYYTIAHIASSPDTSCHRFEPSDTSSALATHPIA